MPKALFFNVPAHGHINPSLSLVAELARREHQIIYFSTPSFQAKIEAAGAEFYPYKSIEDDFFDVKGLHGGVLQKVVYELMTTTEAILPELVETARSMQPDYILYDGMCPWGYMVARVLNVPTVASLSLLPLNSPPASAMLNGRLLRAFLSALLPHFRKGIQANLRAQSLAKKYRVKPLGTMQIMNAPADLEISYTSQYFQPYAETVSKAVLFVGRTFDDSTSAASFSFEQVKGRKLIYISLGTLNNDDAAFFRTCIQAFAGSEYYVVMSTGKRVQPESLGELPENIAVYDWVPQVEVIKRAALFITHAGLNSTHDGLYFGVPLLLVPQQIEQLMTALRVEELGAGLTLDADKVTVDTIRSKATRLLTEPQFAAEAKRIGETFRSAGGMPRAADAIEALVNGRARTTG